MQKRIDELVRRHAFVNEAYKQERKRWAQADELYLDCMDAREILQTIAQTIQQQAHKRISEVVSRCLAAVFDEPYEFSITFERKRGRTEAQLKLSRDGLELGNALDSVGGGVIDVAAFALRLSSLLLSRPSKRRLLVLDEPFRFVHPPEIRPRLVLLLEALSDEFGMQIVLVTGIQELESGTIFQLE